MSTWGYATAVFRGLWAGPGSRKAVIFAGLVFLALIAVHLILAVGAVKNVASLKALWDDGFLRLDVDNSLPEFVEYAALVVAIIYLCRCGLTTKASVFYSLALVNLFILVDATLRLHEQLGQAIRPEEFWIGQLIFFAAAGVVLLTTLVVGYIKSAREYRRLAILATVPLIGLFGSAVLIDAFHTVVKLQIIEAAEDGARTRSADYLQGVLALLEDGGELFFLLANALICFGIYRFLTTRSTAAT